MMDSLAQQKRTNRKELAKQQKRQRIEEAGGVRPRKNNNQDDGQGPVNRPSSRGNKNSHQQHRFGRVMEEIPCRNKSRCSTVSIAVPGSVLANCQTKELRTLLVGQIARAATIYHVDEVIVFDDQLGGKKTHHSSSSDGRNNNGSWRRKRNDDGAATTRSDDIKGAETEATKDESKKDNDNDRDQDRTRLPRSNHQEFMARLLQYCECPQYLRRQFFPMHPDLQFAGLLAPVDAPHHVRGEDQSPYREGVVMNKSSREGKSLVNCGIRSRPVEIDRKLAPGIRCTVQIDPKAYRRAEAIKGKVVSPAAPREDNGTYWGYVTRMATSIKAVFDECPFKEGYDLKIGTSERGDRSVEEKNFRIPKYEHVLLFFGGVAGIEESVDADESIKLPGSQSRSMFDMWLNTCPFQGSRTIRTEEAVLISLSTLNPALVHAARGKNELAKNVDPTPDVEFSDGSMSDESSANEDSSSSSSNSSSEQED